MSWCDGNEDKDMERGIYGWDLNKGIVTEPGTADEQRKGCGKTLTGASMYRIYLKKSRGVLS